MPPFRPPPAIFLHVPKTGGTSFRAVLGHAYPRLAVCADPSIAGIERMLAEHGAVEILAADARDGGTEFANRELMREQNWHLLRRVAVFVMFRDPVEFAVSLHRHIARNLDTARVQGAYADRPDGPASTLERFVDDPLHANLQLAFLVGKLPLRSGAPTTAADLELGRRLLDELGIFVGVLERYADMLHCFEQVTGVRIPDGAAEHLNADPDRPSVLAARLRERIDRANALDRALYEHALRVVERQKARFGPAPDYRVGARDPST